MRLRHLTALALLSPVLLLTGCSGSDDSSAAAGSPGDRPTSLTSTEVRDACQVKVHLTGGLTKHWNGKGFETTRNTSGPAALYKATKGKFTLLVQSKNGDFPPTAVLSVGKRTLTTQGADGVEVDTNGKGATVDADAVGAGAGGPVHVKASFSC